MGAKRNYRLLMKAFFADEPVKLTRTLKGADTLEGFVVGIGEDWLLLHELVDVRLDGWCALRIDTVADVERGTKDDLAPRVLRARGQRPSGLDDVELDSVRSVVRSLAGALPLVSFYREARHPNEMVIGRPARFTKKKVDIFNVDPDATWDLSHYYRLRLADLTRLQVGGDYENGLYQLAGEPPLAADGTPPLNGSTPVVRAS